MRNIAIECQGSQGSGLIPVSAYSTGNGRPPPSPSPASPAPMKALTPAAYASNAARVALLIAWISARAGASS